jgi:hypothetical protein
VPHHVLGAELEVRWDARMVRLCAQDNYTVSARESGAAPELGLLPLREIRSPYSGLRASARDGLRRWTAGGQVWACHHEHQ